MPATKAPPTVEQNGLVHQPSVSPLDILKYSLDNGVQPAQLKEMMDLSNQWRAQEAADRFGVALSSVQSECPLIFKGRQADRYSFAGFDDIWSVVRPIAAKNGLSVSFSQPKAESGWYEIVVHLRVGLHTEARPFSVPLDGLQAILQEIANKQKLTLPQAYGFWLSYQKRYAFCAALNIVVTNEDNDGAGQKDRLIDEAEVAEINDLIAKFKATGTKFHFDKFLQWLQVERLEDLTIRGYQMAVDDLKRNITEQKKAGAK